MNVMMAYALEQVAKFLGDKALAAEMEGGAMTIFRLAPQDYHRFHAPVSGKLTSTTPIDGKYFTVNPIAIQHSRVNVFTENKRIVNVIESEQLGKVVFVTIGATAVGSIVQLHDPGEIITKGECFGYFQFGGSTCIMLTKKGMVTFDDDLLETTVSGIEMYVEMGQQVGRRRAGASL